MTKSDHISMTAMLCLCGLMADANFVETPEATAQFCYEFAEALVAEGIRRGHINAKQETA